MGVKIIRNDLEMRYDENRPLEDQVTKTDQIIINYDPSDKTVDRFVQEMGRITRNGINAELNIRVVHNDNVVGFKLKKQMSKATNDIRVNELIKLMVLSYKEANEKLEDLISQCDVK